MSRYRYGADEGSPFEDDYRGFDIRDDETARGPLILALAIGVLLVFGAVVWNTYRQGVRSNGGGLPSVRPNDDEMDGSDPDNGMPNAVADEVAELADLSRPDRKIESAPLTPMPAPRAAPPRPREVAPQFAFSDSGTYMVQVAAFRTQDAAEAEWRKSSTEHPDLFRGAGKRIQRADLGAKGVFYRLRVGGFSQKTEADAFCDALKAEGDNCIVVTG